MRRSLEGARRADRCFTFPTARILAAFSLVAWAKMESRALDAFAFHRSIIRVALKYIMGGLIH